LEQTPSKHLNMLRSTAARLSEFFDRSPAEVSVDSIDGNREEFSQYLIERKYKTNSLRSYRNYLRILIEKAQELGWVPSQPVIPENWAPIYPLASQAKCAGPLKYFAKRGMSPEEITEDNLRLWVQTMVQRNHSYDGAS